MIIREPKTCKCVVIDWPLIFKSKVNIKLCQSWAWQKHLGTPIKHEQTIINMKMTWPICFKFEWFSESIINACHWIFLESDFTDYTRVINQHRSFGIFFIIFFLIVLKQLSVNLKKNCILKRHGEWMMTSFFMLVWSKPLM